MILNFNRKIVFRVTYVTRKRIGRSLMKTNKSMIPFDQCRAYIMQETSTRNFLHLTSTASRVHITGPVMRRRRRRATSSSCAEDAMELSFIISPGQVESVGIMQLFQCHNLKSWSIRPCHERNQQHLGVTTMARGRPDN